MINILIGNSISKLDCKLPLHIEEKVIQELSHYDMNIYFRTKSWERAATPLFRVDTYYFPTGLLRRLCKVLCENLIEYRILDGRPRPDLAYTNFRTKIKEPVAYEDQSKAMQALVHCPSGRGICVLPTGVGKTRVMKDTAEVLGVKTLIIEPGINLRQQVYEYFDECYGSDQVGLLEKTGTPRNLTVCNLDALTSMPEEWFHQFDCVMFDEYHHEACVTAREINEYKLQHIFYKYAFTATNFRNNKNDQILLESVMANELYSMTPIEAVDKGYICPIRSISKEISAKRPAYESNTPFPPSEDELDDKWEKLKDGMKYHEVYKDFIVNEEERTERTIDWANELKEKKVPTLILVKEIAHGEELTENLDDFVFVNGTLDKVSNAQNIKDFNNGLIAGLIGTSVIGEGIDTKRAGAVILGNAEKAESKIMQNIGRIVRNFPGKDYGLVCDFNDRGHKTTYKHSKRRRRVIKKHFGIKTKILN